MKLAARSALPILLLIAVPLLAQPTYTVTITPSPTSPLGIVNITYTFNNINLINWSNLTVSTILPGGLLKTSGVLSTCIGESDNATTPGNILTVKVALASKLSCFVTVTLIANTIGPQQLVTSGSGDLSCNSVDFVTIIGPNFTKTFTLASVSIGQVSQLAFTITNTAPTPIKVIAGLPASNVITFTDAIPDGLVPGQIVFNSCPTGPVTITPTSISYTATADFPAGGTCTIVVNVTATTVGTKNNSVSLAGVQAFASLTVNPPADSFQVRYASNLTAGDSVINITNTGVNGAPLNGPGFGGAAGNTCVNVYAFSPDEQLISCCSCLITPNGLVSLSVNQDLISNTLTGVRPNSVVVKLVNTGAGPTFTGTSCTNSAAVAGTASFPLAGGMAAFGTSIHAAPAPGTFQGMETPFVTSPLSPAELASITNRCINIVGNGSSFGICRSCRVGGLSAGK